MERFSLGTPLGTCDGAGDGSPRSWVGPSKVGALLKTGRWRAESEEISLAEVSNGFEMEYLVDFTEGRRAGDAAEGSSFTGS